MADKAEGALDWKWRIGALNGVGECAWQQLLGKIRRITRYVILPDGSGRIMMQQFGFCGQESKDPEPQFDAEGLVALSVEPSDQFMANCERVWTKSPILQMPNMGNGFPTRRG